MGHRRVLRAFPLGADSHASPSQAGNTYRGMLHQVRWHVSTALSVGLPLNGYIWFNSPSCIASHFRQQHHIHQHSLISYFRILQLSPTTLYCAKHFPHLDFQLLSHHLISAPTNHQPTNTVRPQTQNHGANSRDHPSKHPTLSFSRHNTCRHESWWI